MTVRFADNVFSGKGNSALSDRQDFAVRKRRPVWQLLAFMFLLLLFVSITLAKLVDDIILFSEILFVLLGSAGTYLIFIIQRARDLVLATEFQNALFSSALSHSNKFCLIVKNDNSVAYLDRSLQEMFPEFYKGSRLGIDVLLEQGRVSIDERKMIFNALERRVRNKIIFDITDYKRQTHRIIMSIEPISRPKGFMLMRGHEFVEKRVLGPELPSDNKLPIFNKTNVNLFSYIMDSMDIGAYMIDLFGTITYANLTLEQLLHFDEDELTSGNYSLKDIISQSGLDISVNDIKNYDGEVTLQRKIGGHIKATISQKAMYDEQGAVISYTGLVYPVKEKLPPVSSKSGNDTW